MAKVDLSGFTNDELTELIDEATSLRTTKFEGREAEKSGKQQESKQEREVKESRPLTL